MHRPLGLCSAAVAVLLVVAGCGPAKSGLNGKNPDQAVQDAVRQAQSTALHMTFKGTLGVDRSRLTGVPAEIDTALEAIGNGGTARGQLDQESGARRKLTLSSQGKDVIVVLYDGKAYYSQDGTRYAEVTGDLPSQAQLGGVDLSKLVSSFSFADAGADTQDGQSVEHYRAPLTVGSLQKLAQHLGASSTQMNQLQQVLALAAPFTKLDRGSLDVWLGSDSGGLVRLDLSGAGSIDVGGLVTGLSQGLGSPLPGGVAAVHGTLGLSGDLDAHVSQLGGGIRVSRPSPDPAAPTPGGHHEQPGGSGATPSPTP